jgi:hypothetical protein
MKPNAVVLVAALFTTALAANTTLKLTINGTPTQSPALVVNGKTYIPLEALRTAGVNATVSSTTVTLELPGFVGGANQRPSLEGCLGETLFNGVWRIKTLRLEAIKTDRPGWGLTIEVRNGTKTTLAPWEAGWMPEGVQLAFSNATTINVDGMDVQKVTFATLPPGGVVTHQLKFFYPFGTPDSAVQKPIKFLLEIQNKIGDSTRAKGVAFNVPNPSLRVRLDCQK